MKLTVLAVGTAIVLGLSGPAFAQSAPMVSGTVEKVDKSAEKITINHGPIPNLQMEAMTMVLRAVDKEMLDRVKVGDKVQFTADRVNGQITVTSIKKGGK